jgi:hypothetical protein
VLDSVVELLEKQMNGSSMDCVAKDTLCILVHYREITG